METRSNLRLIGLYLKIGTIFFSSFFDVISLLLLVSLGHWSELDVSEALSDFKFKNTSFFRFFSLETRKEVDEGKKDSAVKASSIAQNLAKLIWLLEPEPDSKAWADWSLNLAQLTIFTFRSHRKFFSEFCSRR